MVRILFVTAMPTGERLFHAGRKTRALRQRLGPLLDLGRVSLEVESAVRADQLQALLRRHRPHVLHVVSHAVTPKTPQARRSLALEDRRGMRALLDGEALHRCIEASGAPVRVVLLEACRSEPIAEQLLEASRRAATEGRGIRAVIGTVASIGPTASTRFFLTFHELLAIGRSPSSAFADARRDLELLAPGIRGLPVLVGDEDGADEPAEVRLPVEDLEIARAHEERYVRIAAPLRSTAGIVARDEPYDVLEQTWTLPDREVSILHLWGPAGRGKTALLGHWLARLADRAHEGATRVFAWSFDPLAEGPGVGSVSAFLEEALDFFGALPPTFDVGAGEADDAGEWLDGMRLARVVRRERALLVLDGVPTLPHRHGEGPHAMVRVLPPGITALLLELSDGHDGLCVLSTRLGGPLVRFRDEPVGDASRGVVRNLEIGSLSEEQARQLLRSRGVIGNAQSLDRIVEWAGGIPSCLELAAVATTVGEGPWRAPGTAAKDGLVSLLPEGTGHELDLIAALVAGQGSLDVVELRAVTEGEVPREPVVEPWEGMDDAWVEALRQLRRHGIVDVSPDGSIELAHSSLLSLLDPRSQSGLPGLRQCVRERLGERLEEATELRAYARFIHMGVQLQATTEAVEVYLERVCRRREHPYQQSYLSRKLGRIAEDLVLLSELFEPSDVPFSALRDGVAEGSEPSGIHEAFFPYRVGISLRHLGRLSEAVEPLRSAYDQFVRAGPDLREQAATCANDLAELEVHRDCRKEALVWARRGFEIADAYETDARASDREEPLKSSLRAVMLCHATLGHVLSRLPSDERASAGASSPLVEAEACFGRASRAVVDYRTSGTDDFRHLFSRPGYQYWGFLLDQIEREEGSSKEQADRIELLADRLRFSWMWCQSSPSIARASWAYDALARARLLTLCDVQGRGMLEGLRLEGEVLDVALGAACFAVHVLRANQYLWMLPEALEIRAEVHARRAEALIQTQVPERRANARARLERAAARRDEDEAAMLRRVFV